jgi:hypothetical protein
MPVAADRADDPWLALPAAERAINEGLQAAC